MFQVGKHYEFRMIEGGGEISFEGSVEAYEHPMVKLKDVPKMDMPIQYAPPPPPGAPASQAPRKIPARPGRIINVTSPNFIRAVEKVG